MPWDRLSQRLQSGETATLLADLIDHCAAHPSHAEGHYSLGSVLEQLQQPLDARSCWERCLEISPQHELAQTALARLLIRIGDANALLQQLDDQTKTLSTELGSLHILASCLQSPDHLKAAEVLRQGLIHHQTITDRLVVFGWQVAAGLVLNQQHQEAQVWLEVIQSSSRQQRLVQMLISLAQGKPTETLPRCLATPPQAVEQKVWATLGPALVQANRQDDPLTNLRNPEQLLLHPDPRLARIASQRRQQTINGWISSRQLRAPTAPRSTPQGPPPRRWLLIGSERLPQCFLYRVAQKQAELDDLGWDSRVLRDSELATADQNETLNWAEAVILCRLEISLDGLDWIEAIQQRGLPCFYDIDDLLFDTIHSPPPLDHYAGSLSPSLHRRFQLDQPLVTRLMLCCDAVIVSTTTLAERWRAIRPASHQQQPIALLPNRAPAPLLARAKRTPRGKPPAAPRLVVASGCSTHLQCWREELAPALLQLMDDQPKLKLLLLGDVRAPLTLLKHHRRIQHQPSTGFPQYIEHLASADIGLMVLEPGVFTDAKSANRWMEFSLCGLASVVSPTRTLLELIEPERHALIAQGPDQWVSQISSLLQDPARRAAIADHAYRKAIELNHQDLIREDWQAMATLACRLRSADCAAPPGTRLEEMPPPG